MAKPVLVQSFRRPSAAASPEDMMKAFVTGEPATADMPARPDFEVASQEDRPQAAPSEETAGAADIEEGEGGRVDVPAAPPPRGRVVPTKVVRRRGVLSRADGSQVRRVTTYLEPEAAQALYDYCYANDLDVSAIAGEAMLRGLSEMVPGPWKAPKRKSASTPKAARSEP